MVIYGFLAAALARLATAVRRELATTGAGVISPTAEEGCRGQATTGAAGGERVE